MKRVASHLMACLAGLVLVLGCQSSSKCIASFPSDTLNVENAVVREYLAKSNATFSGTVGNVGQSFFDASRDYRPDQPVTRTIAFRSAQDTSAEIIMATDDRFQNVVLDTHVALKDGVGTYTLRNFVPGNTYYYKVRGQKGLLASGTIVACGQVRMIAIDRGFNIRDLGGWKGLGGNKVRYEQIYRGGSLGGTDMDGTTSDITDDDRAELHRLGIRAQLDLRAPTNKGKYAGEHSLHSYSRGTTTLTDADFVNIMTDYGAYGEDATVVQDVAWVIKELKQGRPVYFNCRQGADRTGTIAFVLEGLLGCYEHKTVAGGNQMALDYELTGFSQANLVDNSRVSTSYRGAADAYNHRAKLFYQLLTLSSEEVSLSTLQERCYYYLNRFHRARGASISASDLDWFIKFMLNMSDDEYEAYRPAWAVE